MKALDFIRTLHRSLYIQSTWNYKGLLNLGFAQAMAPTARRLARDREERTNLMRRHMGFFLCNPYLSTYVLGSCIKMEEEGAGGQVEMFKRRVGSPLASVGDRLIWGSLRPAMLVIGVALALAGSLWGPIVFLVGYNAVTLGLRFHGLWKGYQLGPGVVRVINSPWFQRLTAAYTTCLVVGLGALVAVLVTGFPVHDKVLLTAVVPSVILLGAAPSLRLSRYAVLLVIVVLVNVFTQLVS